MFSLGMGNFKPVFTEEEEKELTSFLLFTQSRLYGLTPKEMRELAYELAVRNGIKHPFNPVKQRAGPDWLYDLLSIRKPQATSAARAQRFTRENVDEFFDLYTEILAEYPLSADRIWNVDEVGMLTVPKHQPKIIAKKGQKQVGTMASAE